MAPRTSAMHDLCQRPQAQRSKELRPRAVADREHEQAEQDRLEQRGNREGAELAEDNGDDQRARRRADGEAEEFEAAEDGADRDRQQQEDLRCRRDDPLDACMVMLPPPAPFAHPVNRNSGTD